MSGTLSSRRHFLKAAGAAAAVPLIVPNTVLSKNAPSETLHVGLIGCGSRGNQLMRSAMRKDGLRFVALADCDRPFLLRARQILEDFYGVKRHMPEQQGWKVVPVGQPAGVIAAYNDYRRLLENQDVDAVIAAVPDHWHAKVYMDALDAGKDVYGEKPLSLTVNQGRHIARKVAETGTIFQTGSQQRSNYRFRKACEYVRNGRLGKIRQVDIAIGGSGVTQAVPNTPPPPGLDWEMWLGPAPWVPYNEKRCHLSFRHFWDYSGGQMTDWGAHHCDICQWALGMDDSGPRFVEGTAVTKQPNYYETFTTFEIYLTYANGVTAKLHSHGNDLKFIGEKGTITVNRGKLQSDPKDILEKSLTNADIHLYESDDHMQNWLDCVKTRKQPICPAEVGHRSVTLPHIANICGKLGRKLEWDPVGERFVGDPEANSHLDREERAPYHHMAGL